MHLINIILIAKTNELNQTKEITGTVFYVCLMELIFHLKSNYFMHKMQANFYIIYCAFQSGPLM